MLAGRLLIVGSDSYAEDDIFLQNDMMLTFIIIIMSEDNVTDYSPLHCIFWRLQK